MKIVKEHNGFKQGQLVINQSNIARIVYIEVDDDISEKYNRDVHYVRLALIGKDGNEFANCSTTTDLLKPLIISNENNKFSISRKK